MGLKISDRKNSRIKNFLAGSILASKKFKFFKKNSRSKNF